MAENVQAIDATTLSNLARSILFNESSFGPGALLGPIGGAIDAGMNEYVGAFEIQVVSSGGKGA